MPVNKMNCFILYNAPDAAEEIQLSVFALKKALKRQTVFGKGLFGPVY
jgi:hypothetical protein